MAIFLEAARLDTRITRGAQRIVTQPGRRKTYVGSVLEQDFNSSLPIHRYDLSHGLRFAMLRDGLTPAQSYFKVLDLFYVVMFTPYTGFRLRDEADHTASSDNSSMQTYNGANQLMRKHVYGGISFYRPIYKPVSPIVMYTAGGAVVTGTVDYTNGTVTGLSGTVGYWTGEFDIPVTFSDDKWGAELDVHTNNLHTVMGSIPLEEIRL